MLSQPWTSTAVDFESFPTMLSKNFKETCTFAKYFVSLVQYFTTKIDEIYVQFHFWLPALFVEKRMIWSNKLFVIPTSDINSRSFRVVSDNVNCTTLEDTMVFFCNVKSDVGSSLILEKNSPFFLPHNTGCWPPNRCTSQCHAPVEISCLIGRNPSDSRRHWTICKTRYLWKSLRLSHFYIVNTAFLFSKKLLRVGFNKEHSKDRVQPEESWMKLPLLVYLLGKNK